MLPSDRLDAAKSKMEGWMAEGVELAWLFDGDDQPFYIYRAGQDAEQQTGMPGLAGEAPIAGLVADLRDISASL